MYVFQSPYTSKSLKRMYFAKLEFFEVKEYYNSAGYKHYNSVAVHTYHKGKWKQVSSNQYFSSNQKVYTTLEEALLGKLLLLRKLKANFDLQIQAIQASRDKAFASVNPLIQQMEADHPELFL